MASMLAVPETISSSQARPRAMDLISAVRLSAFIGRARDFAVEAGSRISLHLLAAASAQGINSGGFLRSGQVEPWFRLRPLDRGASAKAPNGCCGLRCERPWLECLAGLLSLPALRPCRFELNTP